MTVIRKLALLSPDIGMTAVLLGPLNRADLVPDWLRLIDALELASFLYLLMEAGSVFKILCFNQKIR
jgi:hypothetical protein